MMHIKPKYQLGNALFKKKKKKAMGWKELHYPQKKGRVLTKCHNTTTTKSLLMVFLKEMRKVKLNKHTFLTKIVSSELSSRSCHLMLRYTKSLNT